MVAFKRSSVFYYSLMQPIFAYNLPIYLLIVTAHLLYPYNSTSLCLIIQIILFLKSFLLTILNKATTSWLHAYSGIHSSVHQQLFGQLIKDHDFLYGKNVLHRK